MQRMSLFDSPSHRQGGGGGMGGNFNPVHGSGPAQMSLGGSFGGGGGHASGGWTNMNSGGGGMGSGGGGSGGSFQGSWGGGYHAQPAASPLAMSGAGGGGGGMGGVVIFYQLDPERFNCAGLFNLVCQYGNVMKICFLKNKEGCAMVEMGDAVSADRVLHNLNHTVIFDAKISIERSRKPYIEEIRKPHQLADGSESYCNFSMSRQNRFGTPERAAKNRFIPPTKVLHFYNVPQVSDDELSSVFSDAGAPYPARIKWLEAKRAGSRSVTGLVEFESVSEACEALVLANHAKVTKSSGDHSGHYEMKLCFSKAGNLAGE
jgi:heterogeneous nuclear ribonucleoprotein L